MSDVTQIATGVDPEQPGPPSLTPPTYREVLERIRSRAGKSNKGAAGYTRWVNRRIGRYFAAFGYLHGMTPNQMTLLSATFTIPGIVAIAVVRPSWPANIAITLVLLAGYAFDSADGLLARLRGGGSLAGEFLDHSVDAVKTSIVHLAVLIAWYRFYEPSHKGFLLIPLAFAAVHTVFFFSLMLSDSMKPRWAHLVEAPTASDETPSESSRSSLLQSFVTLPNDWGVLCISLALLPVHALFGVVYTALLAANALFLFTGWARWYTRLARLS